MKHLFADPLDAEVDYYYCVRCYGLFLEQPNSDTPVVIDGRFFSDCQEALDFLDKLELISTILND